MPKCLVGILGRGDCSRHLTGDVKVREKWRLCRSVLTGSQAPDCRHRQSRSKVESTARWNPGPERQVYQRNGLPSPACQLAWRLIAVSIVTEAWSSVHLSGLSALQHEATVMADPLQNAAIFILMLWDIFFFSFSSFDTATKTCRTFRTNKVEKVSFIFSYAFLFFFLQNPTTTAKRLEEPWWQLQGQKQYKESAPSMFFLTNSPASHANLRISNDTPASPKPSAFPSVTETGTNPYSLSMC